MTILNHNTEQTYHIYRTRKQIRVAYNPTWVFQHGFKGLWFIGYQDELAYDSIEASDLEYIGCMTRGDFEKYCDRCYPVQSRT
jgi:hypothetical protein